MIYKSVFAWFGLMILAVLNGAIRELGYKSAIGELPAHQLSTLTLIILFGIYFYFIFKKIKMTNNVNAWTVGIIWFSLTLLFEFGMGIFVNKQSLRELLHAYNLFEGQVWLFIPLWVLTAPYVFYKVSILKSEIK